MLLIGAHKAELYTRALVGDIVHKRRDLADPGWLVRVGLYLELLTALGIVEAVKDDLGDLLTPAEREAFETSPAFAELRARVNADGWRGVWALRSIVTRGLPRAGPVSALNLMAKRRATLQFLHVHHEDLQHAIALAGPNVAHAQETWHRVFRDAERAVLRQTPDAFPELADLPGEVREFVLWHRQGQLGLTRALRVPGPLGKLLGDQDGLFGSACNQYRDSMNHVADWAREQGLMDHTGDEAVPRAVSLFEAHLNQPTRVALLQQRDGYDSDHLEVGAELPAGFEPPLERARRAARPARAAVDPHRGGDRAAGPHGAAAAVRAAGADHRPGPGGRLAVRGRRRHGRGAAAPRGRDRRLARHAHGLRARRDVTAHGRAALGDRARRSTARSSTRSAAVSCSRCSPRARSSSTPCRTRWPRG